MRLTTTLVSLLAFNQSFECLSKDIPTTNWMHHIYQNHPETPLRTITIPGTHDSATDKMTSKSSKSKSLKGAFKGLHPATIKTWSKTQERSTSQSLEDGIRYLDLRVEAVNGEWWTYHGLRSERLQQVMDQVGFYATQHPYEIILLDFQSLYGFSDSGQELITYLMNHPYIGPRLAARQDFDHQVQLDELWHHDKSIIIFMKEPPESSPIWPRSELVSPWPKTRHSAEVITKLQQGIAQRPPEGFYVSQAVLTPDAHVITLGWSQGIHSLRDMAYKWMNPKLPQLIPKLEQAAQEHGTSVNIIIADHYHSSELIALCLELNQRRTAARLQ